MDVLCVGTVVVDICARNIEKQSNWKEKQRIEEISLLVGGDGANQSIHLADQGLKVSLCASVGDDGNGDMLTGSLEKRGVHTGFIARKKEIATGTSLVLVGNDGNRNTFSIKGAHGELAKADLPDLKEIRPGAITIGSLFSLPVLESDGLAEFLKEAADLKIPVFADLASDKRYQGLDGIRRFLPWITYFMPSLYDALDMTGKSTAEEAARVYLECGCKNVIIKCGEKGCYYVSESEEGWMEALSITPVDTTGAGDCMVALFAARILAGDSMKAACRYACRGASISTLFVGASTVNLKEQMEQVSLRS